MPVEALSALHSLSAEAARERLASYVGPLDFTLFQKLDHGAIVTALTGRPCKATTYVFGNALIATILRGYQEDRRGGPAVGKGSAAVRSVYE
jgi:hypothetical protein